MAVTHVVTFTWTDETTEADVAGMLASLQAWIDRGEGLEGLLSWKAGPDLALAEGNADFGVSATFTDRAAYERYRDAEEHRRIIAEQIVPHVAVRSGLQFEHSEGCAVWSGCTTPRRAGQLCETD